jgi:hypothetical protein
MTYNWLNCDVLAESRNILKKWNIYCLQLLNVYGIDYARLTEMHTAESLTPDHSSSEIHIPTEKLKRYEFPGNVQIPAELTQAGGNT